MGGKIIASVLLVVRAIRTVFLLLLAGVILVTLVTGTFEVTLQTIVRSVGLTGFAVFCFIAFLLLYPALDIGGTPERGGVSSKSSSSSSTSSSSTSQSSAPTGGPVGTADTSPTDGGGGDGGD